MSVRAEVSIKNKYWISKHRYYELLHFCLQYPEWKKAYLYLENEVLGNNTYEEKRMTNIHSDRLAKIALEKAEFSKRMKLIQDIATETDEELAEYILEAVTQEHTYEYMKTNKNIPCSRDTFYDRRRRFFWLLSQER